MASGTAHDYFATVTWRRAAAESFTDRRYSRRHLLAFDGGARVVASSSPLSVRVPFSDPAGVDPEEAFVASLSSCHMLWFLDIACRAGWVVDDYRDEAVGTMAKNADGKLAMTMVVLKPAVRFGGDKVPGRAEIEQLHHRAHEECFIANSVKTEVRCEPRLEGVE
jgi:organic hydroperoxide reductase OsmC/OhrA